MKRLIPCCILMFVLLFSKGYSQSVSGVIIDTETKKTIPYATVTIENYSFGISNDQGEFKLYPNPYNNNDTLRVQLMGYQDFKSPIRKLSDSIFMQPNPFELNEVVVSNNRFTPRELIDLVIAKKSENYRHDLKKTTVFLRESTFDSVIDFEMELKKSTIEEIDEKLIDDLKSTLPTKSNFFVESLFEFYGRPKESQNKIEILKASVMRDEDNTLSGDIIERKMGSLLEKKSQEGSYFKLKSGIFSSELETENFHLEKESDSLTPVKTEKELAKERKGFALRRGKKVEELFKGLFFSEGSKLDVFEKPQKYHFEIIDLKLREDQFIYTLSFKPKGNANFSGKITVNSSDYAVELLQYHNIDNLKHFGLFGFNFSNHLESGTLMFAKSQLGHYELRFAEHNSGNLVSIERPLKLLEKRKTGKLFSRKENEVSFHFKIDLSSVEKTEYLVFDSELIDSSTFEKFKPTNSVNSVRLQEFNPYFWEGMTIIPPNEMIREFKMQ